VVEELQVLKIAGGVGFLGDNQEVITLDDYLAKNGYGEAWYSDGGMHSPGRHTSEANKKRLDELYQKKSSEYMENRNKLIKEYNEKIKTGEIRKPTHKEFAENNLKRYPVGSQQYEASKRVLELIKDLERKGK